MGGVSSSVVRWCHFSRLRRQRPGVIAPTGSCLPCRAGMRERYPAIPLAWLAWLAWLDAAAYPQGP